MSALGHGPVAQVRAVLALHTQRHTPMGDIAADHVYCVEDRQTWPCATVQALDALRCRWCDGAGFTTEREAQCGDYEHEHTEGCEIPVEVPCRCQPRLRRTHLAEGDGEPF